MKPYLSVILWGLRGFPLFPLLPLGFDFDNGTSLDFELPSSSLSDSHSKIFLGKLARRGLFHVEDGGVAGVEPLDFLFFLFFLFCGVGAGIVCVTDRAEPSSSEDGKGGLGRDGGVGIVGV